MSNCSLNVSTKIQSFQLATMIPTFILGVPGNIYVLIMFVRRPRSAWTNMNVYITNMAIADCIMLALLPVRIAAYENKWDYANKELCFVLVSVYYVNMYASIFTVTAISVVRYVAIKYPLKAREIMSCRKSLVVCVLIWLVTCSFSALFHHVDDPKHSDEIKCFQKNKEEEFPLAFILVLNLLGFVVPFVVMTFCSVRVITALRKQLGIGSRSEKIQSMFIMAANLIVFVVCFFPVHFGFVFKYVAQAYKHSCFAQYVAHNLVHCAMSVSNMNCVLDCFSYYFATRTSWMKCFGGKTANEQRKRRYNHVNSAR